jgi:hypothetical protein
MQGDSRMTKNTNIDKYGLQPEDEFYQLTFTQVSDEGALEVRPFTYALMTWWKCRIDQSDSIDIAPDSMSSLLTYESVITGGDSEQSSFNADDEFDTDNVIEVQEDIGLISYFIYVSKRLTTKYAREVALDIGQLNTRLQYGHFEVFNSTATNEYFLRFRSSLILQDVLVGKVNAIDKMVENAQLNCIYGINALCESQSGFKDFLFKK